MQRKSLLARFGPGLITGASDDDPSGVAAYSQAGPQFGYSMSWVTHFCLPLMAAIQEISAGEGIAGNIRAHYSRPLLYAIVDLLLVANIIIPAMRHPSGCSSLVSLASNCRVRRYPRVTTADQPRDQC
jgi:Mn2+/Fe2+ NRAMP family transporter